MAEAARRHLDPRGPSPGKSLGRGSVRPDVRASLRFDDAVRLGDARDRAQPGLAVHERYRGMCLHPPKSQGIVSLIRLRARQVDIVLSPSSAYYVDILHSRSAETMAASGSVASCTVVLATVTDIGTRPARSVP